MNPIQTPEHKQVEVFPGADLPLQSNCYVIRKIDEKDISLSAVVVSFACLGWLLALSLFGIVSCFS